MFAPYIRSALVAAAALGLVGCRVRVAAQPQLDMPIDSPYQVDYPNYDGKVKDFVPQRIGEFTVNESSDAFANPPALESWSAFYKTADGKTLHLRIHRCANAADAYQKIAGDRGASVGVLEGAVNHEPAKSKGKIAGTLARGRYMNQVKGVEGEVVWCTRGNVAFVVNSIDGVHADAFWRELEKTLKY